MENKYVKLSGLVGDTFRIDKVLGFKYKKWDDASKQMLSQDEWTRGYAKKHQVDTNKGKLDLGTGQIGSLLEAVFKNGIADLNGQTFEVKSNGKTGMEIRYFFNAVSSKKLNDPDPTSKPADDEIDISEIPF